MSEPKAIKSVLTTEYADGSKTTYEVDVPHQVGKRSIPTFDYELGWFDREERIHHIRTKHEIVLTGFDLNSQDHAFVLTRTPGPSRFNIGDFVKFDSPESAKRYGYAKDVVFRVFDTRLREPDLNNPLSGWVYELETRERAVPYSFDSEAAATLVKTDEQRWPFRPGDFVEVKPNGTLRKLLGKATLNGEPAWNVADVNGFRGIYTEARLVPAEVTVTKKETWTKRVDVGFDFESLPE